MQISNLKHLNNPENALPIAPSPSRPRRSSWRRFWRHSFLGRVFLFALSSGIGGFFVGALIGVTNALAGAGSSYIMAPFPAVPWWKVILQCACINGLLMTVFGAFIGMIVFAGMHVGSYQWETSRKQRLACGMKKRLFVPLASSLIVVSLLAALVWVFRYRGFSPTPTHLGEVLEESQLATLPLATCLFTMLLARASKTKRPRHQTPVQSERLLPLD